MKTTLKMTRGLRRVRILCVATLLAAPAAVTSASPMFMGIGERPGGTGFGSLSAAIAVSRDGTVVAGQSKAFAIRWTAAEGFDVFAGPSSIARNISGNGLVVVGTTGTSVSFPAGSEAFRWTEAIGTEFLGVIGDIPGPFPGSSANGTSLDGSVIVGASSTLAGVTGGAYRWTAADGMANLGAISGQLTSIANDVSGDGSIVVGQSQGGSELEAFRWTESTEMVGLGVPPGDDTFSLAQAISDNGRFIVGVAGTPGNSQAVLWDEAGAMTPLGDLPGGLFASDANGVTDDGSIVVGSGRSAAGIEAAIWDAANGMRSLQSVLVNDFGLDLTGWTLNDALDISFDGTTIVGQGRNPDGNLEGWIVSGLPATVIPEPSTGILLALALASLLLALGTWRCQRFKV